MMLFSVSLSGDDVGDLEGSERLAMAALAAVVLPTAKLEDDDLPRAEPLAEILASTLAPLTVGLPSCTRFPVYQAARRRTSPGPPMPPASFLDAELVALLHSVLFASCLEHGVHESL